MNTNSDPNKKTVPLGLEDWGSHVKYQIYREY